MVEPPRTGPTELATVERTLQSARSLLQGRSAVQSKLTSSFVANDDSNPEDFTFRQHVLGVPQSTL